MQATDVVRQSLQMSREWVLGLIKDMQSAPLTAPTPNGGNHPLWVLGHLAVSEEQLVKGFALGQPNPLEKWAPLFGQGSQPSSDAGQYPPFDELLEQFEKTRAETLQLLDSLSDADLDKPSHAPDEAKPLFGTVGACLMGVALHCALHGGQVADARRAAGRPPLRG